MDNSRRKLVKAAARAMVVLVVVAAVCLFSINALKREVTHLVQQTLPGLQYAAMADSLMGENYIRCLNLASGSTTQDYSQTVREIGEASRQTEVYLEKYRDTIFDHEDAVNFKKVQFAHNTYRQTREKFFAQLQAQHQPDALHYLKSDVTPAYNDYSQAMRHLFDHKVTIGQIRREQVMLLSFMTPIIVSILFILLFILGLLVSLKFIVP